MKESQLVETLTTWNFQYRKGTPVASDAAYDAKLAELERLNPDNAYLKSIEPENLTRSKGVLEHDQRMLSTEKAYSGTSDLDKFVSRCQKAYAQIHGTVKGLMFRVTPKLDGVAARLYPTGSVGTRGEDGLTGTDITELIKDNFDVPSVQVPCNGELIIRTDYFEKHLSKTVLGAEGFTCARNVMAGLCSADDFKAHHVQMFSDKAAHLVLYKDLPAHCVDSTVVSCADTLLDTCLSESPYLLDGIIIEVIDPATKDLMGSTDHHHRWMCAFKRKGECAQTTVLDITWQVGRTGAITPVLEIDPVYLSNATISRVTAHNVAYVLDHEIGKGSVVEIIRAGEVIPSHERTIVGTKPLVPSECPSCSEPTHRIQKSPVLWCLNPKCPAQLICRLEHFFSTVSTVDLFGRKTLEKLVDFYGEAITDITDIYDMLPEDFRAAGFGEKQSENMDQQLDLTFTAQTDDYKFLAALGIPTLGKGDSKKLLRCTSIENISDLSVADIAAIEGFGSVKASAVFEGLRDIRDILSYFKDHGLFKSLKRTQTAKVCTLSGKRVCFTGTMTRSREEVQSFAESMGVVAQSKVTSKTDFLVHGKNLGASKKADAEKYNVKILSEAEFFSML